MARSAWDEILKSRISMGANPGCKYNLEPVYLGNIFTRQKYSYPYLQSSKKENQRQKCYSSQPKLRICVIKIRRKMVKYSRES